MWACVALAKGFSCVFGRYLSACCPLDVRLLSAFKADNKRTSSGQQADNKRTTDGVGPVELAGWCFVGGDGFCEQFGLKKGRCLVRLVVLFHNYFVFLQFEPMGPLGVLLVY